MKTPVRVCAILLAALLAVWPQPGSCPAAETSVPGPALPGEYLQKRLDALTALAGRHDGYQRRFVQEKYLAAQGRSFTAGGVLSVSRSGEFRMEYDSPAASGVHVDTEGVRLWSETGGRAEKFIPHAGIRDAVSRYLVPLLLFDRAKSATYYDVVPHDTAPGTLRLTPAVMGLSSVFCSLDLLYGEDGLPLRMDIHEKNGDRITLFLLPDTPGKTSARTAEYPLQPPLLHSALAREEGKGALPLLVAASPAQAAGPEAGKEGEARFCRVSLLLENGFTLCSFTLGADSPDRTAALSAPGLDDLCAWAGTALYALYPGGSCPETGDAAGNVPYERNGAATNESAPGRALYMVNTTISTGTQDESDTHIPGSPLAQYSERYKEMLFYTLCYP